MTAANSSFHVGRVGTPEQRELALRLYRYAQAIGEPSPAQCWLDLRDEFPGMTEAQAKAIVADVVA